MKSLFAVHLASSVAFFASAVPLNVGQSVKIAMRRGAATMTWLQKPAFMFLKFDTALHESLPQIVACWKNKKPIDKMMREGPELVAVPGCSWLCVIVHVCTWLWLPPPASKDEVVDIIPAHVTGDDKLFQYSIA